MKNFNELREKIKHFDAQTLESYGLLERAKKTGYICPNCSNGTGTSGTGINFNRIRDGYKGYCFVCENHFDVIDLLGFKYGLNPKNDFQEIMTHAVEIFGIDPPVKKTPPPKPKVQRNWQQLLYAARDELIDFMENKNSWRGLTLQTLLKFHCGYLKNWALSAKKIRLADRAMDETPRIIIPTSNFHYLARYAFSDAPASCEVKQHRGTKQIFGLGNALEVLKKNPKEIIFTVEGEIDAMSIVQLGFCAISFCGSKITDAIINQLKKFPPAVQIIQMFDSDETGQKKNIDAQKTLSDLGFIVQVAKLEGNFKDANEFLEKDPHGLKKTLKKLVNNFSPPLNFYTYTSTNATGKFNCPINLELPPRYFFSAEGIYEYPLKKNGEPITNRKNLITFTPCLPVKIFQTTTGEQTQIQIAKYERATNTWKYFLVDKKTISSSQQILNLADFNVHINSLRAGSFATFLTDILEFGDNPKKFQKVTIYNQPGWSSNDCKNFIFPASDADHVVQCKGYDYDSAYYSKGDRETWLNLFKKIYLSCPTARYVLGLSLAGPLVRLCSTRNFQGVLVSKTGVGKSALVKFAASIYGNPNEIKRTFNGTPTFLDEIAPVFTDLFSWVDEFQSANPKLKENIVTNIYNYAEEYSKGRSSRTGDIRMQMKFRGTRIYTAEQKLIQNSSTQGAISRLIELETNKVIADSLAVKIHQTLNKTFGHFGKSWIEYIQKNKSIAENLYQEILNSNMLNSSAFKSMFIAHKQQISLTTCALQMFTDFLVEEKLLPDNLQSPLELFYGEDFPFLAKILPSSDDSSLAHRALDSIRDLIWTHAHHFKYEGKTDWFTLTPVYGIRKSGGDYYFKASELRKFLTDEGFPADAVYRDLAENNFIVHENNKLHKWKKRDRDGKWFIVFPADVLDE